MSTTWYGGGQGCWEDGAGAALASDSDLVALMASSMGSTYGGKSSCGMSLNVSARSRGSTRGGNGGAARSRGGGGGGRGRVAAGMGADGRPSSGPALAAEWRAVVLPWKRTWAISTGGPLVWLYGADNGEVKRLWASDTDDWLPKLRSRKTPPLVPVPDKDIGVAGRLLPPEASLFNCRAPSPGSLALRRLRMHLYISAATTRNTTTETDEDTTVFILLSPPELSPEISPKLPE